MRKAERLWGCALTAAVKPTAAQDSIPPHT